MKKIGLALSGGGFRASLYHLGLIRFLRDAGILPQVSHITAVSGGSIIAAHLVLNWDRYNGSPKEFDAVAAEFLAFVRLDVRNRITRRFPLLLPFRWPRRLLGYSNRRLTRTGLLEYHYERLLYGDTSLFELPERPMLHILATNLSEGCLCSFNRHGLIMMRRHSGHLVRVHRIHVGLATVPMAVAASSAFPGFFPPLELTGVDVGANAEFGRQAFTDGGVFDNLGVRMFRCLERPLLGESRLSRDDFHDFGRLVDAFRQAGGASQESPLRRLAQMLVPPARPAAPLLLTKVKGSRGAAATAATATPANGANHAEDLLVDGLDDVLRHYQLQREPLFAKLHPTDTDAEALLRAATTLTDRTLELDDQLWLNRHLLEAAVREATGQACFRRLNSVLDGVLVSDVGKTIEVLANRRAGGLVRTAMRATDILMDRVWQLENETFHDTPGFVFARVTDVVQPHEDPTALHPEIQRHTAHIRTDLDRFSMLEISSLIRHGYCVARKVCRSHPEIFAAEIPATPPWDPVPGARVASATTIPASCRLEGPTRDAGPTTVEARKLQASALRRIWSTLLDYRDWTSYIYVPILVPLLVILPYGIHRSYEYSQKVSHLIDSLSQGSRDLQIMKRLLEGPMTRWTGEVAEEVRALEPRKFDGFEILQDSRIIDMRTWNPDAVGSDDSKSWVYGYRRLKVLKRPDNLDNDAFRVGLLAIHPKTEVRFSAQQLQPKLRMMKREGDDKMCQFEATFDFRRVPPGDVVDLVYEHYSPGSFLNRGERSTTLSVAFEADTAEVTRWFLMPQGRNYERFRILRYETANPRKVEPVQVHTEYLADDSTILAYKLLSINAGYTHDSEWFYRQ